MPAATGNISKRFLPACDVARKSPNSPDISKKHSPELKGPSDVVPVSKSGRKILLGCFRRREAWCLTGRGFLLGSVLALVLVLCAIKGVHPFLAPNHPLPGGILVVEGWAPDYALKIAVQEFARGNYSKLYVTGGPIEHGAPLSEFSTYAELGASALLKFGLTNNSVQAVPAPRVQQDRTYNSALALMRYLRQNSLPSAPLNLISIGPHARRSRLLFEKAFENRQRIGIVALDPHDYDARHWWRSSSGVRTVLSETFAYVYFRFFFRARTEAVTDQ